MPPCGEFFVVLEYPCQRVRGFQRGKDAFGAAEGLEGVERLGVVGEPVVDAPDGVQIGVLRADAGIVEPGGNGMRRFDLPVLGLEEHGHLSVQDAGKLVRKTMAGVMYEEVFGSHAPGLSGLVREKTRFLMPPIPNLYFTRDPFACIGRGVSLNRMYSATRNRETVYGSYILKYHPDFAGQVPLYYTPQEHFSIEGGDILNLSESVLAIGMSQRTQPEAIERLAARIFADERSTITTVLAFEIPRTRAFMHLDTVFTQVDTDKFTVHPGILGTLSVYELTGRGETAIRTRKLEAPLENILKQYLHLERVQLIRCGGASPIAAEREQWSDGSNTLCIRPGVVLVYDRNYVTNQILNDCGIETLEMPSSELSRGRGGPRCMSMPLERISL